MAELRVSVLGALAVEVGGRPVELGSRKQRALVALLALNTGRVLSVDRLLDELWGEQPPPTAHHALQVHVSKLRKLLGVAAVVTERPGYALRVPPESCDAERFAQLAAGGKKALLRGREHEASETLTEALEQWRVPALVDLL